MQSMQSVLVQPPFPSTVCLGGVLCTLCVLRMPRRPPPGSCRRTLPGAGSEPAGRVCKICKVCKAPWSSHLFLRQRASRTSRTLHTSPASWQSHGEHAKYARRVGQPPLLRQRASHTSHTLHTSTAPWQSHGEHAKQKRKQDSKKWKYNKQLSGCKAFIRPARVNQK